jgi:hypothetical protein
VLPFKISVWFSETTPKIERQNERERERERERETERSMDDKIVVEG